MSTILVFISWYCVVQLVGIITFPLCWRIFPNLPDRGYAFAKSLGILLAGFILWFGTTYEVLRNNSFFAWMALALLAIISFTVGLQFFKQGRQNLHLLFSWIQSKKSLIWACELLFLIGFVFWTVVRAHDPPVNHTEQPMDLMFINGIWASPEYPPHDPWLSGYAISYYYFGYWLLAFLGRLAHQPPEISYNIGQACWFALLLLGTFGIGYNLLAAGKCQDRCDSLLKKSSVMSARKNGTAIVGGFLTSITVVLAGNFKGAWAFYQEWKDPGHYWWWWPSSRVIQDKNLLGGSVEAITEFPIFSYMLGDNHPHVIAMPFVVLTLAFSLNLFLSGAPEKTVVDEFTPDRIRLRNIVPARLRRIVAIIPGKWPGLVVTAITCGALIPLNTWDFPACLFFLILSFSFVIRRSTIENGSQIRQSPFTTTALFAMILIVLILGIYFPYLLTAQSQFAGFVPNLPHPTLPHHFFLMFGPFFIGIFLLLYFSWKTVRPSCGALLIAIAAVLTIPHLFLWGYALFSLWIDPVRLGPSIPNGLPVLAVLMSLSRWLRHPLVFLTVGSCLAIMITIVGSHWRTGIERKETQRSTYENISDATPHSLPPALCFALCTAGIALFLVYFPEFFYLRDLFGTRMNTIFKLYYQAWLFGGIGCAYATMISFQYHRYPVFGVLSVLLIMATLVYGAGSIYNKTGAFSSSPTTLNGLAQLQKDSSEEFAAVRWIQKNTRFDAVVLEGEGASYNTASNRISTFTGRATLLGWAGHEVQWRGKDYARMAGGRSQIIAAVYNPASVEALTGALTRGDIDYVYLGPWERTRYAVTEHHEAILAQTMDVVFERKSVRVFKPRGIF